MKCGTSEYQCKNKNCIAAPYRCNGNDNCGDNSDESDCYGESDLCLSWICHIDIIVFGSMRVVAAFYSAR